MMPPDADVYVDCSCDYPECCKITACDQWKDIAEEDHRNYGWSSPRDEDVFLS